MAEDFGLHRGSKTEVSKAQLMEGQFTSQTSGWETHKIHINIRGEPKVVSMQPHAKVSQR